MYEFGPYRLDKQRRQLWRDGRIVPVTGKAAEILVTLLERAGEVVSKRELMEAVWSDAYVEEGNLSQNIFLLRKALGETARDRTYILTVPGRGYRFGAEVHQVAESTEEHPTIRSPHESADATPAPARVGPNTKLWSRLAILLVTFSITGYLYARFTQRHNPAANARTVIAVVPFLNLTGDAAEDYFSDGFTDEIIVRLGRINPQHLGVIARGSVARYRGSFPELQKLGKELRADYVLEGSVRRDARKMRIDAELIAIKDQTHVWARQYDRELTDVLGLQASISQDISEQIARMIGGYSGARAQPPPIFSQKEYEAYELYLKGRFFLSKRTPEGFTQAVQYFREAIAKAPENPRPYAALADAYVLMSAYDLVPPGQVIPEARAAAQHALELDDRLAEAHTTLALIAQNYHWDWETAEREFRKAIELDPNYATAHHWYAEHLALENRFEEAFGEIERARQLDPMSLIINTDYGAMLYFSRTYDRAIEQFRTVMEMEPNFPRARILALVYVQRGKFAEAIAQVESWRRTTGDEWSWASSAYVYGRSGSPAKAKKAVAVLKRRHGKVNPIAMCVAEIGLNHKDEALAWLEKAYAMHAGPLTALKVDPVYDPLRGDPRFAKLLERIGLATQPGVSQGIVSEKISPSFTKP